MTLKSHFSFLINLTEKHACGKSSWSPIGKFFPGKAFRSHFSRNLFETIIIILEAINQETLEMIVVINLNIWSSTVRVEITRNHFLNFHSPFNYKLKIVKIIYLISQLSIY